MAEEFVTSVTVNPAGAHELVSVWVRGQLIGTLTVGPGDGERIKNALLGAKYFGIDRAVDGPVTALELVEWRVQATGWLDADEIGMSETGFVGRLVLRLLDEVQRLKETAAPGAMSEVPEIPALVKDFHILYRLTERLVADLDAEKVTDLGFVKAQLQRLLPAFEECEVAKVLERRRKERGTDG